MGLVNKHNQIKYIQMKKLELNKLIREEISKVLKEDGNDEWTQGDV